MVVLAFTIAQPVLALTISSPTAEQTSNAQPLEQKYPSVIGQKLEEIKKLPPGQQMSSLLKYIINFAFFVAIGVAILVLVAAGVIYILANQKPNTLVKARSMAKNALLGLFILLVSYLVLYLINPQLLLFQAQLPKTSALKAVNPLPPENANEVRVYVFNPSLLSNRLINEAAKDLHKWTDFDGAYNKIDIAKTGKIQPQTFLPLRNFWSSLIKPVSAVSGPFCPPPDDNPADDDCVYQSELPLRQTELVLTDIIATLGELEKLLPKCQCGESYSHSQWEWVSTSGINDEKTNLGVHSEGKCMGGMDEKDIAWQFGSQKIDNQNVCYTRCKDCGQSMEDVDGVKVPSCDLREVRLVEPSQNEVGDLNPENVKVAQINIADRTINPKAEQWITLGRFEFSQGRWGWKPVLGPVDPNNLATQGPVLTQTSINLRKEKLRLLLAQLQAQKQKFLPEQTVFLNNTLANNAAQYLLGNTAGPEWEAGAEEMMFENSFSAWDTKWGQSNYKVVLEMPKQFMSPGSTSTAAAVSVPAPTANAFEQLFSVIFPPVWAQAFGLSETIEERYRNANFYTVVYGPALPEEKLKQNQFAFLEAARAGLFSVLTDLSTEKIQGMFRECLSIALGAADYQVSDADISNIIKTSIDAGAADALFNAFTGNTSQLSSFMAEQTKQELASTFEGQLKQKCEAECKANTDTECFQKCVQNNLPPDYIARKISAFLETDLAAWLEANTTLESEVRDFLGQKVNSKLDSSMGQLYDQLLKGALTKSTDELVPGLEKALDTEMTKKVSFLGVVLDQVQNIDQYLADKFKEIRNNIGSYTEKYLRELVSKYVGQKASNLVENFKKDHPSLFTEYAGINECFQKFEQGYVFELEGPYVCGQILPASIAQAGDFGTCEKQTPAEINGLDKRFIPNSLESNGQLNCARLDSSGKKDICEGAGYCWTRDWEMSNVWQGRQETGQGYCQECSWIAEGGLTKEITSGEGVKEALKEAGKDTLRGLVTYGEQLASALLDMIVHTAVKYAQFLITDEVVAPLQPYTSQIMDFHEHLNKFLNSTVRDVLPNDVKRVLSDNIENIVGELCQEYNDQIAGQKPSDFTVIHLPALQVKDEASGQYKPFAVQFSAEFHQAFGENVCRLNKDFHTTLLEEIAASGKLGENLADFINSKVASFLSCKLQCWLTKTPAEMIFASTGLKNITDLVQATPRKIICGGTLAQKEEIGEEAAEGLANLCSGCELRNGQCDCSETSKIGVIANNPFSVNTPLAQCEQLKQTIGSLASSGSLVNALPLVDTNSENFQKLSEEKQDFYQSYCPFVWLFCQNPASAFGQITIGQAVKTVLIALCALKDSPNFCETEPTICYIKDRYCPVITERSMAFSVFGYVVAKEFGPVTTRTAGEKEQEKEIYQWLLVYLPDLKDEIGKIAVSRQFTPVEWTNLAREVAGQKEFIFRKTNPEDFLRALVSARLSSQPVTVKDVLTAIPLGVIKGEEAVFPSPGGYQERDEFLAKTPSELLTDYVCPKIIARFEANPTTKDWALEKIMEQQESAVAGRVNASLPYSMQRLESTTMADAFSAIWASPINEAEKIPYLFCQALEYSPSNILGLDQNLMSYIRPKEVQLLFDIMQGELESDEMPATLTSLLSYLNGQTPGGALMDLSAGITKDSSAQEIELAQKAQQLAVFLETVLGAQISFGQQPLIDFLCAEPLVIDWNNDGQTEKIEQWCALPFSNEQWQETLRKVQGFLKQRPVDLLDRIKKPLFPATDSSLSAIDLLAAKHPFLNQPVVDIVGRQIGFLNPLFSASIAADEAGSVVGRALAETKEFTQNLTDEYLVNKPADAANWLLDALSNLWSKLTGQKAADEVTGVCRDSTQKQETGADGKTKTSSVPVASKDDCVAGEVFRFVEGKKECCTLGATLVCKPRCRTKETGEQCNWEIGEQPSGNSQCCLIKDSDKNLCHGCCKCRLTSASEGGNCLAGEVRKEVKDANGVNVLLCCHSLRLTEVKNTDGQTEETCCQTAVECVMEKFNPYLTNLADMFVQGKLPLRSLSGK